MVRSGLMLALMFVIPGLTHADHHVHGPDCGHEAVPHGDHVDYIVEGRLHHPHGDHTS